MRAHRRAERRGVAEQGVDIGLGQQAAERVHHLLAAAPVQQPVVNNGRAHRASNIRRARAAPAAAARVLHLVTLKCVLSRIYATAGSRADQTNRPAALRFRSRALRHVLSGRISAAHRHQFARTCWRRRRNPGRPSVARSIRPPWSFAWWWNRTASLRAEPTFRKQGHLLSFVSDAHNFAAGDRLTLSASFHLSDATAADHAWLRWFYLESMAYMLLTQRYVVSLHAACVASRGAGILLCGKSGAGKSTLSFACARAGFTYVSDDCTWLLAGSEDRIADRQAAPGPLPPRRGAPLSRNWRPISPARIPTARYRSKFRPVCFRRCAPRRAARCAAWCFSIARAKAPARIERMAPRRRRGVAAGRHAELRRRGERGAREDDSRPGLLPAWRCTSVRWKMRFACLSEIPVLPEGDR